MLCPTCNGRLIPRFSQGVEVDVCEDCGGIFLDRGELEKLMAAAEPTVLAAGGASVQDSATDDRIRERPTSKHQPGDSDDDRDRDERKKKSKDRDRDSKDRDSKDRDSKKSKSKKSKKKRKKGWADMLEDVLDDVLDF